MKSEILVLGATGKTGRRVTERLQKMEIQFPENIIWLMQYLFSEVLDGRNELITNDIERAIDLKPTTFGEYVVKTKQTRV